MRIGQRAQLVPVMLRRLVACTENLSSGVVVMKSAQDGK
jgi:hypothetical protein